MRHFVCTIFNHNYTSDHQETVLGDASLTAVRVVQTVVRARSRRQAAAKAYVFTIGRKRAKILKDLNAPENLIEFETNYRVMAKGLRLTVNRLGTDFCLDIMVEAWYIRVEAMPSGRYPIRQSLSVRRQSILRQALGLPSVN